MISFEEALARLDSELDGRLVEARDVPVGEARGRVLAEAPLSRLDLPPFDKSAMDGYAVMDGDERDSYRVLEKVAAGQCPTRPLEPGTATKIMTGAPVPAGAGRVVMVEDTDGGDRAVRVFRHGGRSNICPRGEDLRTGQEVLPAGTVLDPLAVANLIACGIGTVHVRRRVRVAIVVTGDELVSSADELAALPEETRAGKIIDSNGPMLAGLCEAGGLEVVSRCRAPDAPDRLAAAIAEAVGRADIVVLTGGVSAGDFDYVPAALAAAGLRIVFDRVAIKPGKPLTLAAGPACVALGLPGNPVSVFLSFHLFVLRAASLLAGAGPGDRHATVALAREFAQRRADRSSFVPCRLNDVGRAEPVDYHGSAHLLGLTGADGFIRIPVGAARLPAGESVAYYPVTL